MHQGAVVLVEGVQTTTTHAKSHGVKGTLLFIIDVFYNFPLYFGDVLFLGLGVPEKGLDHCS